MYSVRKRGKGGKAGRLESLKAGKLEGGEAGT